MSENDRIKKPKPDCEIVLEIAKRFDGIAYSDLTSLEISIAKMLINTGYLIVDKQSEFGELKVKK